MAIQIQPCLTNMRKHLILLIRTSYRSFCHYPFVWGMIIFLGMLYRCFPFLFSVLVSTSPVIVCTTVVLGVLLSYGEPNLPEIGGEEEVLMTQQADLVQSDPTVGDRIVHSLDGLSTKSVVSEEDRELDLESVMVGLKVRIEKPGEEERTIDSSLGSPWLPVGVDDLGSDSGDSDGAESSSPDASMADILPMLDELHPLLDCEHVEEVGGSDEEEAHENENAGGGEETVEWTADDRKNAMDLGISDMERNRRLESLIAKRRKRKNLRFTERNLIDFDDLSDFQIPAIFVPKQNPFDLPYDSIPMSAPSIMQPRRNPFDASFDQEGQGCSSPTTENLVLGKLPPPPVPPRESFFSRHESFNYGIQFSEDAKAEKPSSRLKPFFVVEREGEAVFATYQRQLSEMSESKMSTIADSDAASSVVDKEEHSELFEEELQMETEVLSPADHHVDSIELERRSIEEVGLVNDMHKPSGSNVGEGGIDLTTSLVHEEYPLAFVPVEEEIREKELDSTSNEVNLQPSEDKCDVSSSSLKVDREGSEENAYGELINFEMAAADSLEAVYDAIHSVPADSSFTSEGVIGSEVAYPVYDLSPSSTMKSLSNMSSFNEPLLHTGEEGICSSSSLAFDLQADVTERGSSVSVLEKDVLTPELSKSVGEDTDLLSVSGGLGLTSLDLPSRDKNESELDNVSEQTIHLLCSPSLVTKSSDDNPVDVEKSFVSEGDEIRDVSTTNSDTLVLSDDQMASTSPEKSHPLIELFGMKPTSEAGSMTSLPSIPEENVEDLKLRDQHESITSFDGVGLTDLQIVEEPEVGLSDIEHNLSFFKKDSADVTVNYDDAKKLIHDPEDIHASVSPDIPSYDTGITEISLLESTVSAQSPSLLDMKSELQIQSHIISRDSQGDSDIDEAHCKQEGNESSNEPDEALDDVGELEGVDDDLLSELDAVGDFHTGQLISGLPDFELQSDDHYVNDGARAEFYSREQDFLRKFEDSEIGTKCSGLHSETHSDDLDDMYSVANLPNVMEMDVGLTYSSWPSGIEPEMTVYNPKIHILEASSFDELDSIFKPHSEEADKPRGSESIFETAEENTEAVPDEKDISGADPNPVGTDSELRVIEARSIEDINSAFEQLSKQDLDNSVTTDVEPLESVAIKIPLESTGSDSNLEVVDAETLEDIHSALKQLTDGTAEKTHKNMEAQADSVTGETSQKHMEPGVREVDSAEGTQLAFETATASLPDSNPGLSGEKSLEPEKIASDPSPGDDNLRMTEKKGKSIKSGSSSSTSSSSSSSSSDSE